MEAWPTRTDAVLVQDADSFLDPDFVAVTAARLDDGYAAVGGNFHAREGGSLCGTFQRNECARYARDNARKAGRVLCITGVGTLFRASALRAVAAAIADGRLPDSGGGFVYSYATLTEDNWMTLALKHLGLWFLAITVVYSVERIVTVRSRGWQVQLFSAAVFPEWLIGAGFAVARCIPKRHTS